MRYPSKVSGLEIPGNSRSNTLVIRSGLQPDWLSFANQLVSSSFNKHEFDVLIFPSYFQTIREGTKRSCWFVNLLIIIRHEGKLLLALVQVLIAKYSSDSLLFLVIWIILSFYLKAFSSTWIIWPSSNVLKGASKIKWWEKYKTIYLDIKLETLASFKIDWNLGKFLRLYRFYYNSGNWV